MLERLIRLTEERHNLHPAGLKRIDLAQLPAGKHRGLTFPIPGNAAIYSLEVTIQNHRGRLLGRYGEYMRVVDRVVNAGITLAANDNVAPGSLPRKLLRKPRQRLGHARRDHPRTLRRRDLAPGRHRPAVRPRPDADPRTLGPGEGERIGT